MNIQYQITLHSYWHCGSGLAAGAQADALVIKDLDQLPFIPGKTIKGLLRDAVNELRFLQEKPECDELYKKTFGLQPTENNTNGNIEANKSETFFGNATLVQEEADAIKSHNLQQHLYKMVASTAIGNNGVAQDHSLRTMEVTVPCTLVGEIIDVPECMVSELEQAMKFIKQLGSGRTRGLGRCTISTKKGGDK